MKPLMLFLLVVLSALGGAKLGGIVAERLKTPEQKVIMVDSNTIDNQLYFSGGELCSLCYQLEKHPEHFKPGTAEKKKEVCAKYKDFETFDRNLKSGRLQ